MICKKIKATKETYFDPFIEGLYHTEIDEIHHNGTITNKNNSGIVGVYFNKFTNRWRAYITFNKKQKSRSFKTKQEAIDCRRKWEKELFGDFNPINNNKEDS